MQKRRLPKTGLNVSVICLGTMTFGTPVGESEAIRLTHWAIDHGVNFIDTANMYEGYKRVVGSAGGEAEAILGKALKGRRKDVVLATKLGMKVGTASEDEGTSPAAIRKHLDLSLQRLATDYVDVYYLHKPDPVAPLADVLAALATAIRQGKIRHYGISNYSAQQTEELLRVADRNGLPRPVIHQPPYSLLKRDIENDLLPLCLKEQIGVAPYQVLQGGLLTGKYGRHLPPPQDSRKFEKPGWLPDLAPELFDQLEKLEAEARARGRTLIGHAIQETLAQPAVVSILLGVKSIPQLESLIQTVE